MRRSHTFFSSAWSLWILKWFVPFPYPDLSFLFTGAPRSLISKCCRPSVLALRKHFFLLHRVPGSLFFFLYFFLAFLGRVDFEGRVFSESIFKIRRRLWTILRFFFFSVCLFLRSSEVDALWMMLLTPSVSWRVFIFILLTIWRFSTISKAHAGIHMLQTLASNIITLIDYP